MDNVMVWVWRLAVLWGLFHISFEVTRLRWAYRHVCKARGEWPPAAERLSEKFVRDEAEQRGTP